MSSDGFSLVVCAVSAEEHGSVGMVGLARGAVMKDKKTILIPSLPTFRPIIRYVLTPVGSTVPQYFGLGTAPLRSNIDVLST